MDTLPSKVVAAMDEMANAQADLENAKEKHDKAKEAAKSAQGRLMAILQEVKDGQQNMFED